MVKKMSIKEFLNQELLNYSLYKMISQLPHFIDGLAMTQRKELWVTSFIPNKKIKTTDIYSLIYNQTKYLHGDKSAYNVWEGLAADYLNNINLIESKANFGYRTNKTAAAARYASAKYAEISKYIFPEIDKNIREKQFFEGSEIEPYFLLPILPIALINGFNGIAVGYSSNIIPRDPLFIFNIIKKILKGEISNIPKQIPPKIPYFKGIIEQGENYKQFIFKGIIKKDKLSNKTGWLIIEEVPPSFDRNKMIKILEKLSDEGIVISYSEECIKNNFYFKVKVPKKIYEKEINELLEIFKLIQKETETITFIYYSKNNEIYQYDNVAEYLKDWIIKRLEFYDKRKKFILKNLEEKIKYLENQIKFINYILDKKIIIERKKKKEIEDQLIKNNFDKKDNSFDYLLRMPLWSLSQEKIDELNKEIKNYKNEFDKIKNKLPKDLWLEDLNKLESFLKKEIERKAI